MSRGVGIGGAVLLHLLLLWMIVTRDPLVLKPPSDARDGAITYVAPLAEARAPQAITPPVEKPKPVEKPVPPKPVPQKARPAPKAPPTQPKKTEKPAPAVQPQVAVTEPLTPAPTVAPRPDAAREAPAEDFSSRIEAARKRRAEALAQDPALAEAATETESQRANRIARENIAFQQRGTGAEREQTGGVFQLRDVRTHSAEFMFRGWNTNFKRNWSQLVAVDQGSEPDIETAVVKRMIALIRTHKTGEFVWESHRLGRPITLNADMAYDSELRQFLLKEFFPTYVRTGGRG